MQFGKKHVLQTKFFAKNTQVNTSKTFYTKVCRIKSSSSTLRAKSQEILPLCDLEMKFKLDLIVTNNIKSPHGHSIPFGMGCGKNLLVPIWPHSISSFAQYDLPQAPRLLNICPNFGLSLFFGQYVACTFILLCVVKYHNISF